MRKKKNIVIGLLCVTLVLMGIGYSIFNSTLNITGTATTSGSFNVKITNVVLKEKSTKVTDTTEYKANNDYGTVANLSATFNEPTDYITYTITVSNLGSIDALISVTTNPQTDEKNNFKMSCDAVNRTELPARTGTTEFDCTMIFDEGKNLTTITGEENASLTVTVDAVQKATYQIAYVDEEPEESCFVSVIPGEINYYDSEKSGCGSDVTIPNDLRLKTTEVTGHTVNEDLCQAFGALFGTPCQEIKEDISNIVSQYGYSNPNNGLFSTQYSAFVIPEFGTSSDNYYEINKIGAGSFLAKDITGMTLSQNITKIGEFGIFGNEIDSITIPRNVLEIGEYGVAGNSISRLNFANNSKLETIGSVAFAGNKLTGKITFPASLVSIGDGAFQGNDEEDEEPENQITSIEFLGNNLTSIGVGAFANNQLTTLNLSNLSHLTTISDAAFLQNRLTSLILSPSVTSIGLSAFAKNQITGTLTIPSSVVSLGNWAFYQNQIRILNIGSGLRNTGGELFYNNPIQTVNIDMTENQWKTLGLSLNNFFDSDITPNYVED